MKIVHAVIQKLKEQLRFWRDTQKGRRQKIYLILTVRNESYYLPSFLRSIRDYVDGIVALDDGSTDDTVDILREEKKVLDVIQRPHHTSADWDERGNREIAIRRARELGADWVLCADPDERFETRFLKDLRMLAGRQRCCYNICFRELWGSYDTWRSDDIWGLKRKDVFYPLADQMTFNHQSSHHFSWGYQEILSNVQGVEYAMYHLKMVRREDRVRRAELYNALDPEKKMQAIGYDYLVDENGLQLSDVPSDRRYDFDCIPEDMKR